MNYGRLFLKGFIIGFGMLIPGVSGGSIAMIFHIYDEIIHRLSHFFEDKRNFLFFLFLSFGGVLGMTVSSFLMKYLFTYFERETLYFFFGILLFYTGHYLKETFHKAPKGSLFFGFFGVFLFWLFYRIPISFFSLEDSYVSYFILGLFLASALILPGISVSYTLLLFGMYETFVLALTSFDFLFLGKVGFFLLVGVFILIKLFDYLLSHYKYSMDYLVIGFMISSIFAILPKISSGREFIYGALFIFLGGLILSFFYSQK